MIGRRMGWGDHDRSDHRHTKLAEREQFVRDLIAEFAIEPEGPIADNAIEAEAWSSSHEDEFDAATDRWFDWWDDEDRDPFPFDEYDPFEDANRLLYDEIDLEESPVEGREPLDIDDLPGWGTHLDFEDLASLTITNRPYGFSGYGQRDR